MRDLRIVFMGTPGFAVGVLKKLVAEGKNIVGRNYFARQACWQREEGQTI